MNEQERVVDLERLRRVCVAADGTAVGVRGAELAALLAVVDAAREAEAWGSESMARSVPQLRAALEPFTPAEDGCPHLSHGAFTLCETERAARGDGLVFNERMQERERARRLDALGIELVDPAVSDAVSSGAGGRPVSFPGAENGPQILSRPASLEHQIANLAEREQELYSRGRRLERERDDALATARSLAAVVEGLLRDALAEWEQA